ncbi:Rha family transcriptional regulator [Stenotrophomonas maltophilia]|uniref:Rha family transcriptional regulator n=1 Tax=Stenotrophomonas maltophilia TaxID=40324 RepID=UPI00289613AB|nr:Rha family transcriptional regulator [Stenotrophomonas maltophilia]MDT3473854.1 Rha family transcriptional regulator [Stenotrophomonas maltophilia]
MNGLEQVSEVVILAGEQVMTDSWKVARRFNKPHRSILRAYRNLDCSDDFRLRNFVQTMEMRPNPKGGAPIPSPGIAMTKDGFMFLVMGFTGKEAARAKESFIAAFNEMAEFIRAQAHGAMRRFEAVYLEYRHDQDQASQCGRYLAKWRGKKLVHIALMEQFDPQIKLPLIGKEAA